VPGVDPAKLHVRWQEGTQPHGTDLPRRYTLTHSDATGDLFLTIGSDYDRDQISGVYTRLMRDEVLGEWREEAGVWVLHVYCHVSGGIVFGSAAWRAGIFRQHMPQVLQAFRTGDEPLFAQAPHLDRASVLVHFESHRARHRQTEAWGLIADYRLVAGATGE
jgi:hypothetical protein